MEERGFNKTIEFIKSYLTERNIKIDNFFIFGSRSRGDNNTNSDYDFMVVVDKVFAPGEKLRLISNIREFLLDNDAYLSMDLIIKQTDNYKWESQNLGYLAYTVNREGIAI